MGHDPIVDEVRAVRDAYAKRLDYDINAIFEDLKRKQAESGREYVTLPPKLFKGDLKTTQPRRARGA